MADHDTTKDYPERPECDFSIPRPLDQVVREAEGEQLELFPEYLDEKEKQLIRRLKRIVDWF